MTRRQATVRRSIFWWALLSASTSYAQSTASFGGTIRVDFTTIQSAVDRALPAQIDHLGAWDISNGWGTRFAAYRSPIQVAARGGQLHLTTRVEFSLAVCREVPRPWPMHGTICPQIGSCGLDGSPRGSLDLDATVNAFWAPDWSLAPTTSVAVQPGAACSLTIANVNATPFIAGQVQGKLQSAADSIAGMWKARARAEELWARVKPRMLATDVWLAWDVAAVRAGMIDIRPDAIASRFEVDLSARVVKSASTPVNGPLPATIAVGGSAAGSGWTLALDIRWADLDSALVAAVGKQTIGGATVVLKQLGASGSRVQLTFEVTAGTSTDTITTTAEVAYDAAADRLAVTGLDLGGDPDPVRRAMAAALAPKLFVTLDPLLAPSLRLIENALANAGVSGLSLTSARPRSIAITSSGVSVLIAGPSALPIGP